MADKLVKGLTEHGRVVARQLALDKEARRKEDGEYVEQPWYECYLGSADMIEADTKS